MNEIINPLSRGAFDDLDRVIGKRQLDRHPEFFKNVIDELGLGKLMRNIRTTGIIKPIDYVMHNRVLNFFEATSLGDFTINEKRIGVAAAIIISCVHVQRYKETLTSGPTTAATMIPVLLRRLTDYSKLIDFGMQPESAAKVDRLVRMMMVTNPSRTSLKSDRLAIFLRDACMGWITSGDDLLIGFMVGEYEARALAVSSCENSQIAIPAKQLTVPLEMKQWLAKPLAREAFTQWGTARNFTRNIDATLKSAIIRAHRA